MLRDFTPWAASAAVLIVYLGVLSVMPKGFFWSPDEGAKYIQLRSIQWEPGLAYEIPYAAVKTDPGFEFYPTRCRHDDLYPVPVDGQVRLHWPIWFSLLTAPFLALFGTAGVYVIPLLAGWTTALLAGFLVRDLGPVWRAATILLAGLATPVFFYSVTFWEHTLATALGMGALCLVATARVRRRLAWSAATVLLVCAAALRVEMMAFGAALLIAWIVSEQRAPAGPVAATMRGRLLWIGLPLVTVAAALATTLTWRHRWLFTKLPEYLLGNVRKLPSAADILADVFINSPAEQGPVVAPHWELLALGAFFVAALSAFVRSWKLGAALLVPALVVALNFSLLLANRPEAYISLHGVLPVAPFVVFGLYALPVAWRQRQTLCLVPSLAAVIYLLFAFGILFTFLVDPDGHYKTGLEWGTRYMLTLYPIAAALCMVALRSYHLSDRPLFLKRAVAALLIAAMFVGLQFQIRGVRMLHQSRSLLQIWQAALPRDRPVVTNLWWLGASMAPFFTEHPMLCVLDPEKLSTWFPIATRHDVRGFTFASLVTAKADAFQARGFDVQGDGENVVSGLHLQPFHFEVATEDLP